MSSKDYVSVVLSYAGKAKKRHHYTTARRSNSGTTVSLWTDENLGPQLTVRVPEALAKNLAKELPNASTSKASTVTKTKLQKLQQLLDLLD